MIDAGFSPDDSPPPSRGGRNRMVSDFGLHTEVPATPMLTADLPGIGGRIKDRPEDFRVVEQPAYMPSGQGSHLYLLVEKRDLSHEKMIEHVGSTLMVSRRDVGTAGMKDRRAVTRQWVSVPERAETRLAGLDNDQFKLLEVSRHTNSLKPGHLRGNDFEVVIRGVGANAIADAGCVVERLARYGSPNYFGSQRFGFEGSTLATGEALLKGTLRQKQIDRQRRRFIVRLAMSAVQSAVFNSVLRDRLESDLFSKVLEGDVMSFPGSRTVFLAEDVAKEQPRLESGETVLTGPMVGPRMRGPLGEPARREAAALASRGLTADQFDDWKSVAPGTRRPLMVRPDFGEVAAVPGEEPALKVRMSLPSGAYATVVLSELMKVEDKDADDVMEE